MPQTDTDNQWLGHYSMLSFEDRSNPHTAIIRLALDPHSMHAIAIFMHVYANAEYALITKKDYHLHGNLYSLFKNTIDCWMIALDICRMSKDGKLNFLLQQSSANTPKMNVGKTPKAALMNKSDSKTKPIERMLSICVGKTLFDVRADVWQAFTDIMLSGYTNGDSAEKRRNWITFFKQSIRLWELCYRLRELLMERTITFSYY
jgi:hypothetical protein